MHQRSWSRPLSSALIAVTALLAPRSGMGAPTPGGPTAPAQAPAGEANAPQGSPPTATGDAGPTASATPAAPAAPGAAPAASPTGASTPPVAPQDDVEDDASLLAPSADAPQEPPGTPPRPAQVPRDDDEATAEYYRQLYRPAANPGRLNIIPRLTYNLMGSRDGAIAGRMAGLTVDVGQSWNSIGYALTLTANLGDISLRADDSVKSSAMIGGGPSVGLGRLALLQRGYLDLRVGYDFFYVPARALVAGVEARSIAPHGPRLQINMGLLLHPGRVRRSFHGIGATVGYEALVGSLAGGPMPFTSVLLFGLSYWIG